MKTVGVIEGSRADWFVQRVVRHPLLKTRNFEYAKRSRLTWGAETLDSEVWHLSLLGILNGLFGVTVTVIAPPERCEECGDKAHAYTAHCRGWTDGT